jgi:hypothetical protein
MGLMNNLVKQKKEKTFGGKHCVIARDAKGGRSNSRKFAQKHIIDIPEGDCFVVPSGLPRNDTFKSPLKLPQKPIIILRKVADVVYSVLHHSSAVYSHSEGIARIFFRVDAAIAENIRMHHACS